MVMIVAGSAESEPHRSSSGRVSVRVVELLRVAEDQLVQARKVVQSVYAAVDIDIIWIRCVAAHARCLGPVESDAVWLRLAPGAVHPASGIPMSALGYANVDPEGQGGVLATVFVDRVLQLADTSTMRPGILLGLVIAHEIGHLLLGSQEHTPGSLMQAEWVVRLDGESESARFSARDEQELRARVACRLGRRRTSDSTRRLGSQCGWPEAAAVSR